MHVPVMAGHFPQHSVSIELEHRRQPVVVCRQKIEGQTSIVSRPTSVDMIVCRHEPDGFASSSRPDIGEAEHPQ